MSARFSTVGWTGCVCAAALAFYLVSQTVAAKRAEVISVDRRIAATQREIAQLETEISTRGGMAQIENWNSVVYGLQAPGAQQFVHSSVQLVAMTSPQPLPLDPAIAPPRTSPVQLASAVVDDADAATDDKPAAEPVAQPVRPMLRPATYIEPKRGGMAPETPAIQKASLVQIDNDDLIRPAIVKPAPASAAPKATVKAEPKTAKAEKAAKPEPKVAASEPKSRSEPKVAKAETRPAKTDAKLAKAEAKLAKADTKPAAKAKSSAKMTALDDAWLAEAVSSPSAKRSNKGRP